MLKGALNAVSNQQSMLFLFLKHAHSLPGKLFEVGKLDRKTPWAVVASERAGRYLTPPVSGHRPWKYNNIQFRKFQILISDDTKAGRRRHSLRRRP